MKPIKQETTENGKETLTEAEAGSSDLETERLNDGEINFKINDHG